MNASSDRSVDFTTTLPSTSSSPVVTGSDRPGIRGSISIPLAVASGGNKSTLPAVILESNPEITDAVSKVLQSYDWSLVARTTRPTTNAVKQRTHVKRPMNGNLTLVFVFDDEY